MIFLSRFFVEINPDELKALLSSPHFKQMH